MKKKESQKKRAPMKDLPKRAKKSGPTAEEAKYIKGGRAPRLGQPLDIGGP